MIYCLKVGTCISKCLLILTLCRVEGFNNIPLLIYFSHHTFEYILKTSVTIAFNRLMLEYNNGLRALALSLL